jgi:hypothetical protein
MMAKFGWFLLVAAALIVAACGRQVTPNPPGLGAGGAPPGFMVVKFDVNGPFNFSAYQYWVVFNTTNNGLTPLTNPGQNNFAAFSDGVEVGGANGGTFATAFQWIKNPTNPAIPPHLQALFPTQAQIQYVPNSNGTGTEFTVTFQRQIFRNLVTPTPGPTPTPVGATPPPYSQQWTFNAFVTQANAQNQLVFVDSMGVGGATDTTWTDSPPLGAICTDFDQVYYKLADINPPSDPSAQIASVEIANNGSTPPPCPP